MALGWVNHGLIIILKWTNPLSATKIRWAIYYYKIIFKQPVSNYLSNDLSPTVLSCIH